MRLWWGLVPFFFFQAEDGIRDIGVTGVQTCALPIFPRAPRPGPGGRTRRCTERVVQALPRGRPGSYGHSTTAGRRERRRSLYPAATGRSNPASVTGRTLRPPPLARSRRAPVGVRKGVG